MEDVVSLHEESLEHLGSSSRDGIKAIESADPAKKPPVFAAKQLCKRCEATLLSIYDQFDVCAACIVHDAKIFISKVSGASTRDDMTLKDISDEIMCHVRRRLNIEMRKPVKTA